MNIWNKVFLACIIILSLVAIVMSANVLKVYSVAGKSYEKKKSDTAAEIKKEFDLLKMDKVPALEIKTNALVNDLSERWLNCKPIGATVLTDEQAGGHTRIEFTLEENSAPMKIGDMLYVFDQRPFDKGGCYIGRFLVNSTQGQRVNATSVDVLAEIEKQQLQNSITAAQSAPAAPATDESGDASAASAEIPAGWAMYLKCPTSNFDLIPSLSEEERKTLSASISDEAKEKYDTFMKQMEEFQEKFDQWQASGQNESSMPPLPKAPEGFTSDFQTYLTAAYQERVENAVELSTLRSQLADMKSSSQKAEDYLNDLQNENDKLSEDQKLMVAQKEELQKLCDSLEQEINDLKNKIQSTQKSNEERVRSIQASQQRALSQTSSAVGHSVNK